MRYFPQLNKKQMRFHIECFAEINENHTNDFVFQDHLVCVISNP